MNLNPQLYNFRINRAEPNLVYFDSTKAIQSGLYGSDGFVIDGTTVTGVNINTGLLTNHSFILADTQDFWSNLLIRYEGGSDITDLEGNPLFDFTLQYIRNISSTLPATDNVFYVNGSASGANDGSSETDAFQDIQDGVDAIDAGDTLYIKAYDNGGDGYENVDISMTKSGTLTKPIKIIGYKNDWSANGGEGDAPLLDRETLRLSGSDFDSSEMPLLSGASPTWLANGNSNIIIKNIQIKSSATASGNYCFNIIGSNNVNFYNVYTDGSQFGIFNNNDGTYGNRILRSYFSNTTGGSFRLYNRSNLIDDVWAVSTYDLRNDYYISMYGGDQGHSNCVRNSRVHRYKNDSHTGHGIGFKGQEEKNDNIEYSLVENCIVINTNIEARLLGCKYNVYRNIEIYEEAGTTPSATNIRIADGASYNTFENVTVHDADSYVRWNETEDDGYNYEPNGHHNKFINCTGYNLDALLQDGKYQDPDGPIVLVNPLVENNEFINCTFKDINNFEVFNNGVTDFNNTNTFTNVIFDNVGAKSSKATPTITYSNIYSSGFSDNGTGNIDPPVDPNYAPFPTVTNDLLQAGTLVQGAEYDSEGNQRYSPVTLGIVEIVTEPTGGRVRLSWTNSISPGVYETVIYRNEDEIGRVPINQESIWYDLNAVIGETYKYEVQAVSPTGESTEEDSGIGGNVVNLTITG